MNLMLERRGEEKSRWYGAFIYLHRTSSGLRIVAPRSLTYIIASNVAGMTWLEWLRLDDCDSRRI